MQSQEESGVMPGLDKYDPESEQWQVRSRWASLFIIWAICQLSIYSHAFSPSWLSTNILESTDQLDQLGKKMAYNIRNICHVFVTVSDDPMDYSKDDGKVRWFPKDNIRVDDRRLAEGSKSAIRPDITSAYIFLLSCIFRGPTFIYTLLMFC